MPQIQRRMKFRSSFNTKKFYGVKRMHHFLNGDLEKICKNKEEDIYLQMKSRKGYANIVAYFSCIRPRKARRKKGNIALMG